MILENDQDLKQKSHIDTKIDEKSLTQEELWAKERDAKRRRIKYKSVHTSRSKSHTEVMKEVIENQMELYKEHLAVKVESDVHTDISETDEHSIHQTDININNKIIQCKIEPEDMERPHSSISRHSGHSSRSRSKSNYEHQKEYHKNGDDYKRKSKEHDRKRGNDSKYNRSAYKEKRRDYRDRNEDYRPHSRDKRERYYKSDRRH